jgi:hypothetical protein
MMSDTYSHQPSGWTSSGVTSRHTWPPATAPGRRRKADATSGDASCNAVTSDVTATTIQTARARWGRDGARRSSRTPSLLASSR